MASVMHRQALRRDGTWVLSLLLMAVFSMPGQAAETVQSLRYGASLYHFYQKDYFSALTELMAAQQMQALGVHSESAEMLRGGMSLSYGMDIEATRIFENHLDSVQDGVSRNQAWFYLGKLAWQRGDLPRTLSALSNMEPDYEGPLKLEAEYLQASALLKQGDTASAAQDWGEMPFKSPWRRHLGYNLGADQAVKGDSWKASYYFSSVTKGLSHSEEEYALADKANTAAGYAYLSSGEFSKSLEAFRRVRLEGPYTTKALLGYGWSAAEQGDYVAALAPWQQLAQGELLDESVREGLLALPYAYDRLNRPGVALEKYQFAHSQYAAALSDLEKVIVAFQEEPLPPLLGIQELESADWLFDQDILPGIEHSIYLEHLVAQHSFQVALRELSDLYSVAGQLSRAQQRLSVLQEVDAHQQAAWASIAEKDLRNTLAQRQRQLGEHSRILKNQLRAAIEQDDSRKLAPVEVTALWSRLDRAATLADSIDQASRYGQRLKILRGLMIWNDNEAFPERAWRARVSIKELDALTEESVRALRQVDEAVAAHRQSGFAPRIAKLIDQAGERSEIVHASIGRSETQLREVAIAELRRQAEQLARAMGQSQLAIAQLHDRVSEGAEYE